MKISKEKKTDSYKVDATDCSYVRVIPRDYLQYGKDKNMERAVSAILNHLGQAKTYS